MYLEAHEVLKTNLPIFREKEDGHYSLVELHFLNKKIEDYEKSGYVLVKNGKKLLFKTVYKKKD